MRQTSLLPMSSSSKPLLSVQPHNMTNMRPDHLNSKPYCPSSAASNAPQPPCQMLPFLISTPPRQHLSPDPSPPAHTCTARDGRANDCMYSTTCLSWALRLLLFCLSFVKHQCTSAGLAPQQLAKRRVYSCRSPCHSCFKAHSMTDVAPCLPAAVQDGDRPSCSTAAPDSRAALPPLEQRDAAPGVSQV